MRTRRAARVVSPVVILVVNPGSQQSAQQMADGGMARGTADRTLLHRLNTDNAGWSETMVKRLTADLRSGVQNVRIILEPRQLGQAECRAWSSQWSGVDPDRCRNAGSGKASVGARAVSSARCWRMPACGLPVSRRQARSR